MGFGFGRADGGFIPASVPSSESPIPDHRGTASRCAQRCAAHVEQWALGSVASPPGRGAPWLSACSPAKEPATQSSPRPWTLHT